MSKSACGAWKRDPPQPNAWIARPWTNCANGRFAVSGSLPGTSANSGVTNRPGATHYTGRFAPTPSGPLHLGSLLTALASWLDARAQGGRWLLRIDDLDTPRVEAHAESRILASLVAHGLAWDGPVHRQSFHVERHRNAIRRLGDQCFACRCSRGELRGFDRYPGTCRDLGLPRAGNALRIRVRGSRRKPLGFDDRIQGSRASPSPGTLDDFIVQRRDGFASYPLAVVVDDDAMGVNQVVRGADLLGNTPDQLLLMDCLGLQPPEYAHLPVIVEACGVKLSKHNQATAIDDSVAQRNLATAFSLLGFDPPQGDVRSMLDWGIRHWDIHRVPKGATIGGFVALA